MVYKPHRPIFSLNGLEYPGLWKGVAFVAPLNQTVMGGKTMLLDARGGLLNGADMTAGSTAVFRGTPYGLGVGISGASNLLYQDNFLPVATSNGVGTGDFTVVCLANPPAEAVISIAVSQFASGSQPRFNVFFNINPAGTATPGSFMFQTRDAAIVTPVVAGAIDGNYHLFGGARDGSNVRAWVDGQLRASVSGAIQNVAGAGAGFAIGSHAESTGNRINTATNIVFVAAWNRALSAAEMRMLGRDPFCMFRPRRDWIMKAAGGADVRNHIIPAYMRIAT